MAEDPRAPQTVAVNRAPRHMENPVEVAVTDHPNDSHASTTKMYLSYESARWLADALNAHLYWEQEE